MVEPSNKVMDMKEDSLSHNEDAILSIGKENNLSSERKDDLDESGRTATPSDEGVKGGEREDENSETVEGKAKEKNSDDKKKKLESERRERENALTEEERIQRKDESGKIKNEGNQKFGEGNWYEAAELYTKALDCCPLVYTSERSVYFSNRAACYIKLSDWDAAINDCTEAIELGAVNEKPLERRAHCYAQTEENYERALQDYEQLIKRYPNKEVYAEKVIGLKRAIDERNERLKQDMLAKLKDLGNMCLRPFGLSTDNFQLTPQPGGGYSISMKK